MKSCLLKTFAVVLFAAASLLPGSVLAEGTNQLGDPIIPVETRISGMVHSGVGMMYKDEGTFELNVPEGVKILQVIAYWSGATWFSSIGDERFDLTNMEDPSNPVTIQGTMIGGEGPLAWQANYARFSAFRADITDMGLVKTGNNVLKVSGMSVYNPSATNPFGLWNHGVIIMVTYDDGNGVGTLTLKDGHDFMYCPFATSPDPQVAALGVGEPVDLTFEARNYERKGNLAIFGDNIEGEFSGPVRLTSCEVTINGVTTTYSNSFTNKFGGEVASSEFEVTVPAGIDSMTVQCFSRDDENPDVCVPAPAKPVIPTPASYGITTIALILPDSTPLCNAGGYYSETCDGDVTTVEFDGSASEDPDGGDLSYSWSTDCSESLLEPTDQAVTQLYLSEPGLGTAQSCQVSLTVSDGANSASCEAPVYVEPCTNECVLETASAEEVQSARKVKRAARVLRNRTRRFTKRAKGCGSNKPRLIVRANKVYDRVAALLDENITNSVEVCEESVCTASSNETVVNALKKENRTLYRLAKKAKLMSINACNSKHDPNSGKVKRTEDYRKDMLKQIKKLPETKKRC